MDELGRNSDIRHLLNLWEWCSSTLHVKWERAHRYRNELLIGLAGAVNEGRVGEKIGVMELANVYRDIPVPLFTESALLELWQCIPTSVLELALGYYTEDSPLKGKLNRIRMARKDNPVLDQLYKKMKSREKRYGSEWPMEGHHPESDYVQLQRETESLYGALERLVVREHIILEILAREVLSQGGWKIGQLPPFVRKTPESLLNRALRLKLWRIAQEIRLQGLSERSELEELCIGLTGAISRAASECIKSQGYTVDQVVDDFLNFDMHLSRESITGENAP